MIDHSLVDFLSGKVKPACLKGWEMAIKCLIELWDVLQTTYNIKFLLTNCQNQHHVENLLSVIRAKGGQRDNPDCGQFRAAFAQVIKAF